MSGFHIHRRAALGWAALVWLAACTGTIGDRSEGAAFGQPGADDGAGASGSGAGAGGGDPSIDERDVGRVGLHRLNNTEYDNTLKDLLGVTSTPAASFIADEKAEGFDNIASALGMTAAQYEQYFQTADALVEQVWADEGLRGQIVTCTPAAGDAGQTCARQVLSAFGARAYRRPLSADEMQRLLTVVEAAQAVGESPERSLAQAVKTALSSPLFLYRVELDADPASTEAHPLTAYELASRLSYLLWSTMPDDALFDHAADGSLLDQTVLLGQLDRLLDDPRGQRFVDAFAGQWLGLRALRSHQVDPDLFPAWSESLRDAMIDEGLAYFDEFLHGARGMDTFFTADVNFVDDELAGLYDMQSGPFLPDEPRSVTDDARRGFLGLASFLTFSSFSYRTAPTLRGKWVLENLLCTEIPPPPANVPQLDDAMTDAAALASQNVRERLAAHRVDPSCASCHRILDPIGFGLERFDAIGAYRDHYDNGDTIDASGELPDGSTFDGLHELSTVLSADPRLLECTSEKALTYALGRELSAADKPHLEAIRAGWQSDGLGLRALLERIVTSEPFRMRRGEAEP